MLHESSTTSKTLPLYLGRLFLPANFVRPQNALRKHALTIKHISRLFGSFTRRIDDATDPWSVLKDAFPFVKVLDPDLDGEGRQRRAGGELGRGSCRDRSRLAGTACCRLWPTGTSSDQS